MKRIYLIAAILCSICNILAGAETPTGRAVYRITNVSAPTLSMSINSAGNGAVALVNSNDALTQRWYLEPNNDNSGFYIRNVANGAYLKSPKRLYTQWPVVTTTNPDPESMLMSIEESGTNFVMRPWSQKNLAKTSDIFAHYQAGGDIVCWNGDSGTAASHWTFTRVAMTDEELEAMLRRFDEQTDFMGNTAKFQASLDRLFEDKACTRLRNDIVLDGNEDYNSLPPTLRTMVDKIAGGNWEETNPKSDPGDWNSDYAKKYRVQLYEPYSEGSAAAGLAGIQAYTNMNNPTGILADSQGIIYVMVDSPVPEGATLYIGTVPDENMYNSVTAGVQLQQGLNTVMCYSDNSHLFIYYTVNTVKDGKPTSYNLKNFEPIKIHIEGGRLNGFFNPIGDDLYTADNAADFEYTIRRATHPMYDLVGKYVILHLHLNDTPTKPGGSDRQKGVRSALYSNKSAGANKVYDPVSIMDAWDKMCLSERILMGITSDEEIALDYNQKMYESIVGSQESFTFNGTVYSMDPGFHYNEYFNNRMMGISMQGDLFMNATSWRTAYNVSTIDAILTDFCHGDIWGPAHEYGHMNQGPMKMAGTTEESNNIFSNVATYFAGRTTSRCDFMTKQFELFQEGKTFLDHSTWGTTRMFWQLWCYYHATGHNKKFYPRLIEILRKHPLKLTTVGNDGTGKHMEVNDKLHFARMACIAAQEDLTNFFEAWGFFVPLDGYPIDDYSKFNAYLTKEEINAVKQEIKEYGFEENNQIILIDDRPGSSRESYSGFPKEQAGQLGGLADFSSGKNPSGNFSFTIDINTVTVDTDGEPGAGYLIWDQEGNLLGFANSNTFDVSPELAEKLRNGDAYIEATGAGGTTIEVTNLVLDGTPEQKKEVLSSLIASGNEFLNYIDPTKTKVGYILPDAEAVTALQTLLTLAQEAMTSGNGETLTGMITELTDAYNAIITNEDIFITINPGDTYLISNFNYDGYVLSTNWTRCTAAHYTDLTGIPYVSQWIFTSTDKSDEYLLQNALTSQYANKPTRSGQSAVNWNPQPFTLLSLRDLTKKIGVFSFAPDGNKSLGLHVDAGKNVVGWDTSSLPTQWYITKIKDASTAEQEICEELKGMLSTLAAGYEGLRGKVDPSGNMVGFVDPSSLDRINELVQGIRDIIESGGSSGLLSRSYLDQKAVYDNSMNTGLYIGVEPGAAYRIINYYDKKNLLSSDGKNPRSASIPTQGSDPFANEWILEPTGNPNEYHFRNYGHDNYIHLVGVPNNTDLWMTDLSEPFTLVAVSGVTGVFGIAYQGKNDQAIHRNESGKIYRWKISGSQGSQWYLTRIHDAEYVGFRETYASLIEECKQLLHSSGSIDKDTDGNLTFQPGTEYPHLDGEKMKNFHNVIIEATNEYTSYSSSNESLAMGISVLREAKVKYEAYLAKSKIVYLNISDEYFDGMDDGTDSNAFRNALPAKTPVTFEGFLSLNEEDIISKEEIMVTVTPIGGEEWAACDLTGEDLDNEYRRIFELTAPGATLFDQYTKLESEKVDGFYKKPEAWLEQSSKNNSLDLIVDFPCSGVYNIAFSSNNNDIILVDPDHDTPSLDFHIYPNLLSTFGKESGFNIEGFSYVYEEGLGQVISLPEWFTTGRDLSQCTAYIPGTYFADEFRMEVDLTYGSYREARRRTQLTRPDASVYCANVDLSSLAAKDAVKVTATVSKNGATGNYTFYVKSGENRNVSVTGTGHISIDGENEEVYYDMNGLRVTNPVSGGIYIRRHGIKTEKVIIKQ